MTRIVRFRWGLPVAICILLLVIALAPWVIDGIRFIISDVTHSYNKSIGAIMENTKRQNGVQYHLFKLVVYCIPVVFIVRMIFVEMRRKMQSKDDDEEKNI